MADPVPLGQPLGFVPIKSLTGNGGPSVLPNAAGLGFVSPSLNSQPGVNKIDIKSFSVTATPSDKYSQPPGSNRRPWLWGPPPVVPPVSPPPFPPVYSVDYEPVFNADFCFLKTTQRSALGVLTDTTGPPVSVVILY